MEFNKAVGLRIKEARTNKHLSLKELGSKVGLSEGTMQRYETGQIKGVDINLLKKISDILECTQAYLMGWENKNSKSENSYPLSDKEYTHITKYRRLDTISKELIDIVIDKELERINNYCTLNDNVVDFGSYKEIPCYPKLASAGTGEYLFDDIPTNTIKIDTREYPKADYAIQVNGDSMEPTYYDGDTLIVERNAKPEIGKTGIFIVDGVSYVKRMGNGELISDNKAYSNIVGQCGECLGKVLGKL